MSDSVALTTSDHVGCDAPQAGAQPLAVMTAPPHFKHLLVSTTTNHSDDLLGLTLIASSRASRLRKNRGGISDASQADPPDIP